MAQGEKPQDDLFGEFANRRLKLQALYKITGNVEPREFCRMAVRAGIFPKEQSEEFVVARWMPEVRAFFDWVHPVTGLQTGYKTQSGVRKKPEDALELDLEFDILEDCKQSSADRERIRQKIRVMKNRCEGRRPAAVPAWIWNAEDDKEWGEGRQMDEAAD